MVKSIPFLTFMGYNGKKILPQGLSIMQNGHIHFYKCMKFYHQYFDNKLKFSKKVFLWLYSVKWSSQNQLEKLDAAKAACNAQSASAYWVLLGPSGFFWALPGPFFCICLTNWPTDKRTLQHIRMLLQPIMFKIRYGH